MNSLNLLKKFSTKNIFQIKIILLGLAILFISSYGFAQNQKVHITGNFPNIPGAKMFCIPLNIDTPLNNGKLDIWLDSIETGAYTIGISYPLKPDSNFYAYRSRDGKIKYLKSKPATALISEIYLNPNQSHEYTLIPIEGISAGMIQNYKRYDNERSGLYSLNVISKSEDARLYQKLEKIKENYDNASHFKIMDSLYKCSTVPDKIYSDYDVQARNLNYQYNYASLLKAKRNFALRHLKSPIALLSILDVDSSDLAENLNIYEQIMDNLSGRAVESDYYKNMKLRIQNLSGGQLKEGALFAYPSGKTPELKKLIYNPLDYKYTLVEFWASWCGPCRTENPEWNALLNKYRNKGFQILGVSLDQYPQEWKKAIKKDSLNNWLHVSDLEDPWTCANVLRYGIQAIPFNVLLDSQGRIVKKDIQPQELDNFLGKL